MNELKPAPFVALEGSDGAGKGTQFSRLIDHLNKLGIDFVTEDFPRYNEPSSAMVKLYLNGKLGSLEEIGPELASMFFAIDRAFASKKIIEARRLGKLVLTNRFAGSNLAHQGAKINNKSTRYEFYRWAEDLEFNRLQIPRPDVNIVLLLPAEIAQRRVDQKSQRTYTDNRRDIHEADLEHLQRSVEVYEELCELFPDWFIPVEGVRYNLELTEEEVHQIILGKIEKFL